MNVIQRPSPNSNTRYAPVDCIVLHATADRDTAESIAWCCTPAPKNPNPVSYHVIVDRDGTVYSLVPTAFRAWHAGVSSYQGRANVNGFSIGLSFANDNAGEPLTDAQYTIGSALVTAYVRRYPAIRGNDGLLRITRHADIALPPGRKTDPAKPFDLAYFVELVESQLDPNLTGRP